MPDAVHELYRSRSYPAMSHPLSDPAVSAVAAALAGLDVGLPAQARILEIGCSSGLNLIPLALRWPQARLAGIDLSVSAIQSARELAAVAGLTNVEFHAVDLRDFSPAAGGYDFIIAHGFFSWVPNEVKVALLEFCRRNLAPQGIATVSFNVEAGWLPRFPVIQKVRAMTQSGATDEMAALAVLKSCTATDSPEFPIIEDMMAKGREILTFDDFAPVNDPWSLERFVQAAASLGLRWLGESAPGDNLPRDLEGAVVERLQAEASDSLAFHAALDRVTERTFRSAVLCCAEAPVTGRIPLKRLFEICVRRSEIKDLRLDDPLVQAVDLAAPSCVPVVELLAGLQAGESAAVARQVWEGIQRGSLLPRIEPVRFDTGPRKWPKLNAFRMECARRRLPLVDIWHKPCSFPARHYEVLQAMDGSLERKDLAALSYARCPELAFEPWLRHLEGRGMFG